MKKFFKAVYAILILYIICNVIFENKIFAVKVEEEPKAISVKRKVTNADELVENTFSYSIEPVEGNPAIVNSFPNELTIKFKTEPEENVAIATNVIDLSAVDFPSEGLYKYLIKEKSSSNPDVYPVDDKNSYELFILVSDRNGQDVVTVLGLGEHYIDNVDQNEKMEIEFCSEKKSEEEKEDNKQEESNDDKKNEENGVIHNIIDKITPKTGDRIVVYIAIISFALMLLIFVVIKKKSNKIEEGDNISEDKSFSKETDEKNYEDKDENNDEN